MVAFLRKFYVCFLALNILMVIYSQMFKKLPGTFYPVFLTGMTRLTKIIISNIFFLFIIVLFDPYKCLSSHFVETTEKFFHENTRTNMLIKSYTRVIIGILRMIFVCYIDLCQQ